MSCIMGPISSLIFPYNYVYYNNHCRIYTTMLNVIQKIFNCPLRSSKMCYSYLLYTCTLLQYGSLAWEEQKEGRSRDSQVIREAGYRPRSVPPGLGMRQRTCQRWTGEWGRSERLWWATSVSLSAGCTAESSVLLLELGGGPREWTSYILLSEILIQTISVLGKSL